MILCHIILYDMIKALGIALFPSFPCISRALAAVLGPDVDDDDEDEDEDLLEGGDDERAKGDDDGTGAWGHEVRDTT